MIIVKIKTIVKPTIALKKRMDIIQTGKGVKLHAMRKDAGIRKVNKKGGHTDTSPSFIFNSLLLSPAPLLSLEPSPVRLLSLALVPSPVPLLALAPSPQNTPSLSSIPPLP